MPVLWPIGRMAATGSTGSGTAFPPWLPHLKIMTEVATLLAYDALLRAQDGDADGSLIACRALLNTGRSVGDEPLLISQSGRMRIREKACKQIEYSLAHGVPSDAALGVLGHHLADEESQPLLLFGLRGERACVDRFVAWIDSGEVTPRQIRAMGVNFPESLLLAASPAKSRTALLRFYSGAIEIAKLPRGGAGRRSDSAGKDRDRNAAGRPVVRTRPEAGGNMNPAAAPGPGCSVPRQPLAAERYRLAHGHWPSAPAGTRAGPARSGVPEDPFDGKPLRFRRLADGVSIYLGGPGRP